MDRLTMEELLHQCIRYVGDIRGAFADDEQLALAKGFRDLALSALSQEAVRDEALEEAARECGLCASRQATKHDQKVRDQTRRDLAAAIRALKREPNAAGGAPDE